MNHMDAHWWELPGPATFLRSAWEDVRGGKNVVLALPATAPPGLRDGLSALVRQAEMWAWRDFPAGDGAASPAVLIEQLHHRFAPPKLCGVVLSADTLAGDPRLADTVIWVEGITATCWPGWRTFLSQYERACQMRPELGRGLFCVPLTGKAAGQVPEPAVALSVRRWWGVVGEIDLLLDLSLRADGRRMPALHRRLALAVACELSGTDAALARVLAELGLRQLLEPQEFLRAEAVRRGWDAAQARRPNWEDGLIDGVNGEERGSFGGAGDPWRRRRTESPHMEGRGRRPVPIPRGATAAYAAAAAALPSPASGDDVWPSGRHF